jgi:hypothetical protein
VHVKKEYEDERDEYYLKEETEAKRKLPGYRSPRDGDGQYRITKPKNTHTDVDNRMGL